MVSITTGYVVAGIPELELDCIRSAGKDDFGIPLIASTVRTGDEGAPLRCCLTEAAAGERIALMSGASWA